MGAAKNIAQLKGQIKDLNAEINNLTMMTWMNALRVLGVDDIHFDVEPMEQHGVHFEKLIILSVGGKGSANTFAAITRGNDSVMAAVREMLYQNFDNAERAVYDVVGKDTFIQHLITNKIDYDEAAHALMAVSYLDGEILRECLSGKRKP